ncbi:MAG TPA: c-type cytochrome [Fimbriimonadaceae bacterium]|nr:c-type cytochrome [Fimbriimonadaceae bacterium]HRJ95194.1 c-type cytochrome [Fimbriimonadaceae bacterium]
MRALYALALAPLAIGLYSPADPIVDKHVATLTKAPAVTLKLAITQVGGATEEGTLVLSKPNFFKWETPRTLAVSDGKDLFEYDKAKKTYVKKPASPENLRKVLGSDATWAWSAFLDEDFAKSITGVRKGAGRKVRNVQVTDVAISRKDRSDLTLFIEDATGMARGVSFITAGAAAAEESAGSETIVFAKEVTFAEAPLAGETFAWTPPADAKEAAEAAAPSADATTFAAVKSIFDMNCAGCHMGPGAKKGVDLTSYAGVRKNVTPGNPSGSRIMREINRGSMPPTGRLPKEQIDLLAKWIADGAHE